MRIIRLTDFRRRRQRSAADLDAALERALELRDLGNNFEAELKAADALAGAFDEAAPTGEALVALRAAISARKAAVARRRTRRIAWQTAPGALAAAVVGVLAYVGVSGGRTQQPPQGPNYGANADQTLRVITEKMAAVQRDVAANDAAAAAQSAAEARAALVQAQQEGASIPADIAYHDLLLLTAEQQIAQLERLLAQAHLPPVPPLPPVPVASPAVSPTTAGAQASPASSTTTSTTEPPSSSTTSSSTSSTSTTQGGGVLATATGSGKGTSSGGSTTTSSSSPPPSSTTSSSSTTTSSTTTSTTAPPPPSTTSTTAPPGP